MRIQKFLICFCMVWGLFASAAKSQTLDLGKPTAWTSRIALSTTLRAEQMPSFDLDRELRIDAINEANKVGAWRFGYEHIVDMTPQNAGYWHTLANGDRVWRLRIKSVNALSMRLIFTEYNLPVGAKLFMYDAEHTRFIGAYTHQNNNADNMLGTTLLEGADMILEYTEPANVAGQGRLRIGKVVHAYRNVGVFAERILRDLNDSEKCNYDVNCPISAGWQSQINSVAMIMDAGSGICSGALVNNTANDGRPYFLTANHCTQGGGVAAWVFRFNWETANPVCAQNAPSPAPPTPYNEVNGCVLRANSAGSDFALLELNSRPQGDVYMAGWDKTATIPTEATGIHHPSGDIKKFSRENNPLTSVTFQSAACWRVANWDNGTTEGGSSGSPLFDQNKRIVGQLYGGGAACNGLVNNGQADNYGRFATSWVGGGTNATRLSNWLDPQGLNPNFLDGYNPNQPVANNDAGIRTISGIQASYCNTSTVNPIVSVRNFGFANLTQATIQYGIVGGSPQTFNWTGNLATGASTTVALPAVTGNNGANTFFAYTDLPNMVADSNHVNDTTRFSFNIVQNGLSPIFTILPDCFASETSWELRNSSNQVVASGSGYSDAANPSPIVNTFCLPIGCYTLKVDDAFGDGLQGAGSFGCSRNGDFFVVSPAGDTVANLNATNGNFGRTISQNFCITSPTAPSVGFTPNRQNPCAGATVNFTNQSTGAVSYAWTFEGGTPATSTASAPSVSYATAGVYAVTLTATNSVGSTTSVQTAAVTVSANNLSINAVTASGSISTSIAGGSAPYTYAWNNGRTTANITGVNPGTYTVTVTDASGCRTNQSFVLGNPVGVFFPTNVSELQLFPNPTEQTANLSLRLDNVGDVLVQVYTPIGQLISQQNYAQISELQTAINLSDRPAGVYLVRVFVGSEAKTLKLVKGE